MIHASDPERRTHPVDPVSLSAYRDDALEAPERRAVEEHLAGCPACRERLAAYSLLGSALRPGEDDRVPASVDRRVAALLRERTAPSRPDRRRVLSPALAAILLVALVAGALLSGLPLGVGTGGPSVAAAYPCDDPAECVVAVRFSGQVDRGDVERSLRIDPPVPVATSWRADTLLIKPVEPLRPDTSYTLSLNPEGAAGRATPVELRVVVGETATPAVVATVAGPASRTRTPTPPAAPTAARSTPASGGAARPTATEEPPAPAARPASPTASPTAGATATPCPIQPVRGFGLLYRGQPAVAARLGCPRETEQPVQVAVQPFRNGTLIWRADRKEILALLSDGGWRAYPDTFDGTETVTPVPDEPARGFGKLWREQPSLRAALGPALGPEKSGGGAVQAFDGGLLVWTDERVIRVLYADGTWESYLDAYREPTPSATGTPAATPTAITTPSPAPTGAASPVPTLPPRPTVAAVPPSVANCPSQPVRGFGVVYRESPGVADRLGCARAAESPVQLARQTFERGVMLWRADTREVLVLRQGGSWSLHSDTWREGEALSDAGPVPAGRLAPDRGFGKVWRQASGIRQALGWATGVEQPLPGAVQEFAGGRMLWTGDRVVYVLYPDGAWQGFADTFVEPTATSR